MRRMPGRNLKARCGTALLTALALTFPLRGQSDSTPPGRLEGSVFTAEAGGGRAFVPGARVHLHPLPAVSAGREVVTDALGRFVFPEVAPGRYSLSADFSGLRSDAVEIAVKSGKTAEVEIELKLPAVKESVTVSAQTEAVDVTQTVSAGVLRESEITNAPNVNERFETLLPLLPGVVRGPDGLINLKGGRASQGGMLLNSANVTDPVTGNTGVNLPIDVVSTVQVFSNPYDPEYGKLSGAVATVDTRVSDFDKFRFRIQNFMPRFRKRDGTIMGIESSTPRLLITGPLKQGRLALTQSFEYRYVRTPVETLPPLQRDTGLESFDSYTQVDLNLSERQSASFTLAFYPQKLAYYGLNSFTPQPATPDLRQRGYFTSFSHRFASTSGALLASQVSFKKFDFDVKAHSDESYQLWVETTTGGFFNRQNRDSGRIEWQEIYTPLAAGLGRHQLKIGFNFVRNAYDGSQDFRTVEVLRLAGRVAERIDFAPARAVAVRQREYTGFLLDKWTVHPRATLDLGLRFDRDSISGGGHLAPRVGLAFTPFRNNRTVVRGGAGLFYDKIPLNLATFLQLPQRTVTRYSADSAAVSTVTYRHDLGAPLDNPRALAWNIEVLQEVRPELLLRVGYSQRNTVHDYFVEPRPPVPGADTGTLLLSNAGRNRYREFEVTVRYRFRSHVVSGSYVRSSAIGDLNDFNQFFGNLPNPLIRPNERSLLPFDAPHRVLLWGEFKAPWKLTFAPVLDVHTGFPLSVVDEERDFVGSRNRAGRFPTFSSMDLQVTKEVRLPVRGRKYKAHAGFKVFNLFNHYNPRDFQSNLASVRHGTFLNSVDRLLRGKFVLEF